jgi:hypothetical protein
MSRGPGVWQRPILRATSGTVVATVRGIVKTTVVSPDRDDFKSAKRGAKGLALAQRLSATYVYACVRCGEIQDSETLRLCCGQVRPTLAVCGPGRLERVKHPAPYPGGQPPPWVNNPVPSRPTGQLPGPSLKDLADLAVRKAFEGLLYGKSAVSVPDAVAVARLAWQVERDQAIPERDAALRQLEKWQQDMTEFTWALRMVLDRQYPGAWPAVMAEIRKHCPAAPR